MRTLRCIAGLAATVFTMTAHAVDFTEGFNDITTLAAAGWVQTNTGAAPTNAWFQGNGGVGGVFNAQGGAPNAYIAADFLSSASGVINNLLISPVLSITNASTLTFYTRSAGSLGFADQLEVLFGTGSGTDIASFVSLGKIGLTAAYPTAWTLFSMELPDVASGRFAFRQGGTVDTADYLGIDTVTVTAISAVPEPSTYAMFALGLAGLTWLRRRQSR